MSKHREKNSKWRESVFQNRFRFFHLLYSFYLKLIIIFLQDCAILFMMKQVKLPDLLLKILQWQCFYGLGK